jgi:hypothetical protein
MLQFPISANLRPQERRSLHSRLIAITQVSGRDDQRPSANQVPSRAIDSRLRRWKARNPTTILQIFGVSEQHHAFDLVLHCSAKTRDGIGHDCRALRVSTCCNGSIGAFCESHIEEAPSFSDGDE